VVIEAAARTLAHRASTQSSAVWRSAGRGARPLNSQSMATKEAREIAASTAGSAASNSRAEMDDIARARAAVADERK
jgi:hypothetical protein